MHEIYLLNFLQFYRYIHHTTKATLNQQQNREHINTLLSTHMKLFYYFSACFFFDNRQNKIIKKNIFIQKNMLKKLNEKKVDFIPR